MASIYVHLDTKDVDNAFLRASGAPIPESKKEEFKLNRKDCTRCKFKNNAESMYCSKCGIVLSAEEIKRDYEIEELKKKVESMAERLMDYEIERRGFND